MGEADDSELAEKAFGRTRKIAATGNHQPTVEDVSSPFEGEDSILNCFCKGCGLMFELNGDSAQVLAEIANVELPENVSGKFFQTGCCPCCDSFDSEVLLRDKSELIN